MGKKIMRLPLLVVLASILTYAVVSLPTDTPSTHEGLSATEMQEMNIEAERMAKEYNQAEAKWGGWFKRAWNRTKQAAHNAWHRTKQAAHNVFHRVKTWATKKLDEGKVQAMAKLNEFIAGKIEEFSAFMEGKSFSCKPFLLDFVNQEVAKVGEANAQIATWWPMIKPVLDSISSSMFASHSKH